jgi:hypothetical protein
MSLNLYSSGTTDTLLAAKVDLAGGTMTGALNLSASGIIFSDATYLTTAPAGSTLAADQLTAGVVAANPLAGPTTAGDVLQYDGAALIWAAGGGGGGLTISSLSNGATSTLDATVPTTGYVLSFDGTNLIWAAGGGGGGAAWGSITGTLSAQTDLQTALDAKQNKSTLVTHSVMADYYVTAASENGVVYLDPSSSGIANVYIPDGDTGYEFANGSSVTICNNSGGMSPVVVSCYGSAFTHLIFGSYSLSSGQSATFWKISGNDWFAR